MRRAKADRFESASHTAKLSPSQAVVSRMPEKPDKYWSAPGTQTPLKSVGEIGYVRRSEISADHAFTFSASRNTPRPTRGRVPHRGDGAKGDRLGQCQAVS